MTPQQLHALAQAGYNRAALVRVLPADLDTPLSIYLKLANAPLSFLLESVQGGERFGRYSFIGLPARTCLRINGHDIRVECDGAVIEQTTSDDPLTFVSGFLQRYHVAEPENAPRFAGGLCGYFGYDTVRYIERRLAQGARPDDLHTPDCLLLLTEELVVVDNLSGLLKLIVYVDPNDPHAHAHGTRRLDELAQQLRQPLQTPDTAPVPGATVASSMDENAYKAAVLRAQQYIHAGDIMQVVLSQRMSRDFHASPLTLYRALRSLNPSPYMFYYDMGDFHIVGASPEILVRLEDGTITLRPIAGTRPRGHDDEHDLELAEELLADPKECAEHLQLLDLGRNDTGRVSQTGSVRVTERMQIERYSHVMHIVSNVEGRLRPGLGAMDVLRATFPAGTISGAPKIRAMEIIDELETVKRGIYAGAVGYLGFDGNMDLAIAIRTALVKDGRLHVQAGAGIVADSVPESEWTETRNKARAVLRAAELADAGLTGGEPD
ncbi:MAG: anthranilate synthase component I [Betaproteobacteria bacterium]|nr:anthranilate synthase component I [Betaproteobacteria bacterium]